MRKYKSGREAPSALPLPGSHRLPADDGGQARQRQSAVTVQTHAPRCRCMTGASACASARTGVHRTWPAAPVTRWPAVPNLKPDRKPASGCRGNAAGQRSVGIGTMGIELSGQHGLPLPVDPQPLRRRELAQVGFHLIGRFYRKGIERLRPIPAVLGKLRHAKKRPAGRSASTMANYGQ